MLNHTTSVEEQALNIEGDQLLAAIRKVFPSDSKDTWTYEDFETAVKQSRTDWENKDRLAGGKIQKHFHNIMRKFDAHSNLFQLIPQGDKYTSLLTGAATILVKASVNHVKTSEELSNALEAINEAAARCNVESDLIKSKTMQQTISKLYIAIFLFLSDAILWYRSTTRAKVLNSLQNSFSEKFKRPLASITSLSLDARRVADMGTGAEVRVVRMELEELQSEVNDARAGLTGEIRRLAEITHVQHEENLEQHERTRQILSLGQEEIAGKLLSQLASSWNVTTLPEPSAPTVLLTSLHQPTEGNSVPEQFAQLQRLTTANRLPRLQDPQPDTTKASEQRLTNQSIRDIVSKRLEKYDISHELGSASPTFSIFEVQSQSISTPLSTWLSKDSSDILYLEYSSMDRMRNPLTSAVNEIIRAAYKNSIPTIAFFENESLNLPNKVDTFGKDGMTVMILSLVYQIFSQLPPLDFQEESFSKTICESDSWEDNISLLEKAFAVIPPLLICILDGFQTFTRADASKVKDFVRVLRNATDQKTRTLKTLLTSRFRLSKLISMLSSSEVRIVNGYGGPNSTKKTTGTPVALLSRNVQGLRRGQMFDS